jgi:glutamate racemase
LKEAGIDALILSCTHYPFIKNVVEAEFGNEVTVIDPAEATAKLSKEALEKEGLLSIGEGNVTICCTADLERVKRLAARMLPLKHCEFKEISLDA